VEEALIAYLLANPGLAAQVGLRIDWLQRPQGNTMPALTLQIVGGGYEYIMDGREGLVAQRVQMDAWAPTYASMKATFRALVLALDGLPNTGPFKGAFIQSQFETVDVLEAPRPQLNGATDIYRTSIDVIVWHSGTL
jgi:hypothetical protein